VLTPDTLPVAGQAQERFITVSSTTSTEQSGLFGHILPIFTRESGITVRVVARNISAATFDLAAATLSVAVAKRRVP